MENTINEIIKELADIGDLYPPRSKWAGIFSKHTHQEQAKKLKTLLTITTGELENNKVAKVIKVVAEIYYSISSPGALIAKIHACLSTGTNFRAYCKAVQKPGFNKMQEEHAEYYDVLPTMVDYRSAIDPTGQYIPPAPVYAEPTYTS